jgi:hypothetical protein
MDYRNPSGCHPHKSKSSSVLPVQPELDLRRPRSGIRQFGHVPSIRHDQQKQTSRKFPGNLAKFKLKKRSVSAYSGPMQWRSLVNKGATTQRRTKFDPKMPQTLEELAFATANEQRAINELQNIRDPVRMMKRVPAAGQGCVLIPQTDHSAVHLDYPYPQHIPSAAAVPRQTIQPYTPPLTPISNEFIATAPQLCQPPVPMIPLDRIMFIACGIAIAVGALFVWIFRKEVAIFGGISGIAFLIWKLGQWNTRIALENLQQERYQQGRLVPAQPQYIIQPFSHEYHRAQMIPGGW